MSVLTAFSKDIDSIREKYDTSNPLIASILKAKEDRLKLLQQFNKQEEEKFRSLNLEPIPELVEKKRRAPRQRRKPVESIRRSTRLQSSPKVEYSDPGENTEEEKRTPIERPALDYGEIPGVEVGCHWETRVECSRYGVHRPAVAGIHAGPNGAYSIALSGGYPEDVDEGETFIYTGAGGRDLKGTSANPKNLRTAPQTKDQQLEGTNLSLVRSTISKLPIRVIRGYRSPSIYAPQSGYRYDGLYRAVSYWEDVGKTGFRIYRFKMERIKEQAPPPWESNGAQKTAVKRKASEIETPERESSPENEDSPQKDRLSPEDCSFSNESDSLKLKSTEEEANSPAIQSRNSPEPCFSPSHELSAEPVTKKKSSSVTRSFPKVALKDRSGSAGNKTPENGIHSPVKLTSPKNEVENSNSTDVNMVVRSTPTRALKELDPNVCVKTEKEVDNQIQTCLNFFFKLNVNKKLEFENEPGEENFHGWE